MDRMDGPVQQRLNYAPGYSELKGLKKMDNANTMMMDQIRQLARVRG